MKTSILLCNNYSQSPVVAKTAVRSNQRKKESSAATKSQDLFPSIPEEYSIDLSASSVIKELNNAHRQGFSMTEATRQLRDALVESGWSPDECRFLQSGAIVAFQDGDRDLPKDRLTAEEQANLTTRLQALRGSVEGLDGLYGVVPRIAKVLGDDFGFTGQQIQQRVHHRHRHHLRSLQTWLKTSAVYHLIAAGPLLRKAKCGNHFRLGAERLR